MLHGGYNHTKSSTGFKADNLNYHEHRPSTWQFPCFVLVKLAVCVMGSVCAWQVWSWGHRWEVLNTIVCVWLCLTHNDIETGIARGKKIMAKWVQVHEAIHDKSWQCSWQTFSSLFLGIWTLLQTAGLLVQYCFHRNLGVLLTCTACKVQKQLPLEWVRWKLF